MEIDIVFYQGSKQIGEWKEYKYILPNVGDKIQLGYGFDDYVVLERTFNEYGVVFIEVDEEKNIKRKNDTKDDTQNNTKEQKTSKESSKTYSNYKTQVNYSKYINKYLK